MNAIGNRNPVRVGALGAILVGLALAAVPAHADRMEKHFSVQDKPKVTLRNSTGRIQVKSWSKNEVLVSWTNASGKAVVETEQAGNRVEIDARTADGSASQHVFLSIKYRSLERNTSIAKMFHVVVCTYSIYIFANLVVIHFFTR